jgi:hypothetical protein
MTAAGFSSLPTHSAPEHRLLRCIDLLPYGAPPVSPGAKTGFWGESTGGIRRQLGLMPPFRDSKPIITLGIIAQEENTVNLCLHLFENNFCYHKDHSTKKRAIS